MSTPTSTPTTPGSSTATGTGTVALGDTGVGLFPLCLGGNVFGWTADEEASHAVLDAYRAAGGNLVDTADVYSAWVEGHSGGESESVIGRWLAASPGGRAACTSRRRPARRTRRTCPLPRSPTPSTGPWSASSSMR